MCTSEQKMFCKGWQCLHNMMHTELVSQVSMNRTIMPSHHNNGIKLPFIARVCKRFVGKARRVSLSNCFQEKGKDRI